MSLQKLFRGEKVDSSTMKELLPHLKTLSFVCNRMYDAGYDHGRAERIEDIYKSNLIKIEDWIIPFEEQTLKAFKKYFNIKQLVELNVYRTGSTENNENFSDEFLTNPQFRQEILRVIRLVISNFCINNKIINRSDIKSWDSPKTWKYIDAAIREPSSRQEISSSDQSESETETSDEEKIDKRLNVREDILKSLRDVLSETISKKAKLIITNSTDMTDIYVLSDTFKNAKIIAIESNKEKCKEFKSNISQFDNVSGLCSDVLKSIRKIDKKIDLIYYVTEDSKISDIDADVVIHDDLLRDNIKNIILKVNNNFDEDDFDNEYDEYDIVSDITNKVSYKLLHF